MLRKITKAKLHDDQTVEVIYREIHDDSGIKDAVNRNCGRKAHQDLIDAFEQLDIHLAALCEQGELKDYEENPVKLEKFHCTQFSIGGDGENEGVTLTGIRFLVNNKVLSLNAPFVKFQGNDYIHIDSLDSVIKNLLLETDQYLNGTKLAPSPQLDLFPNEEKEINEDVTEDESDNIEKPKRGRSRSLKFSKEHPLVTGNETESEKEEVESLQSK